MTARTNRNMSLLHTVETARGRPLLLASEAANLAGWLSPTRSLLWIVPMTAILSGVLVTGRGVDAGRDPVAGPDLPAHVATLMGATPVPVPSETPHLGGTITQALTTSVAPGAGEGSAPGATEHPAARGGHEWTGEAANDVLQAGTTSAREALPEPKPGDLSTDDVEIFFKRGEDKLQAGELAAARLYFARIFRNGDSRGAVGMAWTFDPEVLAGLPVIDQAGHPDMAEAWYERAGLKHTRASN